MKIFNNNKFVLTGKRNWNNILRDVQICSQQRHQILNIIVCKEKTKYNLEENIRRCMFSPSLSTFQQYTKKGHFATWLGIEGINFEKVITKTFPTAKEHLDQERANLKSTKLHHHKDLDDYCLTKKGKEKPKEITC